MRQQDFAVVGSDRPVFHARLAFYRGKLFLPDGRRLLAEFAFPSDEGLTVSDVLQLTKQKYGVDSPLRPYKTVFTIPGDGADGNCVVENMQIEAEIIGIHCFFFREQRHTAATLLFDVASSLSEEDKPPLRKTLRVFEAAAQATLADHEDREPVAALRNLRELVELPFTCDSPVIR